MKRTPQQAVVKYYSRLGTRLGYKLVMKKGQHFGYYDSTHTNEAAAQEKYHEEFAKLLDLKPGMKLLDAGSGQGVVATYLAKHHNVDVTGITIVPHEVVTAEKTAAAAGVTSLTHFMVADYADPPLADNSFDRIYTNETLSHAVDVKAVLGVFLRLLKPGGKLVCHEYEFDYDKFDFEAYKDARFVQDHAAIHGIFQFDLGEFKANLQDLGFTNIKEEDWTEPLRPSFERIARIGKPVAYIARELHLEKYFVNAVASDMYSNGYKNKALFHKVYLATKPHK